MEGLGIDLRILVGQVITFLVLMYLLKRFAYKPFLSVLEKRSQKIEEGIKKTEEAEVSLKKIRNLAQEFNVAQEKRSREAVVAAEVKAQERTKAILALAEKEKAKIIENAKIAMEKEHERMHDIHQKESVDLAFRMAQKALKETMTKDQDKKIIEKLVSDVSR
jgi:F-type H+-transporting ATPase subunit b